MTGATGLEPATSAVTGQRSNRLSYAPAVASTAHRARACPSSMPGSGAAPGRERRAGVFYACAMALIGPPPMQESTLAAVLLRDIRDERAATVPFPPGETSFSLARTRRIETEPMPMLVEAYERFGPIFTLRLLHGNVVFMLGPAANHHLLVSEASNFTWRDGHFRDLIALMGDGLLTIDGEFHRRSRMIMLPTFHREHLAASIGTVLQEAEAAVGQLREGMHLDLYAWTRRLALRIAMRALFGLDPDGERARAIDAAGLFETALSFYSTPYYLRVLRGRHSAFARMQRASRSLNTLIYSEISERRATGKRGVDILSLLLDAQDEDGSRLSDVQIRDEVMTLMFAGHDTTTSTVSFMFHELSARPDLLGRLVAEQDELLVGGVPSATQLMSGELGELEMVLDETLRMYPPAWVGPRRSVEAFEFAGHTVPAKAFVNYCSWASHHLPDVFEDPSSFRPERFTPEAKAALPKGAYVPFGGGSRTCIGMRFGQLEIRAIASLILSRFTLTVPEDFRLEIHQMPTISPKNGLPVVVGPRAVAAAAQPSVAETASL